MNTQDIQDIQDIQEIEPNPYGVFNLFKYSTVDERMSPYDSARSALRNVQRTLDENDSYVMEDLSKIDNRKLLRRLNVETGKEVIPRLANLCANFDADFIQFSSDPAAWTQAHHGMDFESFWDMLYRMVSIAEQGYVEY